jgi:hypothetical protein
MKFFLLSLLLFIASIAQAMTPEERQKRREELHRQMRERMLGSLDTSDRWMQDMERMMDELLSDSMREMEMLQMQGTRDLLGSGSRGMSMDWSEDKSGRTLTVIPDNKEAKLDVQVLNGVITIKSELKTKYSQQLMTRTQLVPEDCDGDRVQIDGSEGKLVLRFPWKKGASPSGDGRKPLKPQDAQVDT